MSAITFDTLKFMERLENGNSFDGTAIAHEFELGDFMLTNPPTRLYETEIRKIKLLTVAKTVTTNNITLTHYGDTKTTGTVISSAISPISSGKRVAEVIKGAKLGPHIFHSLKATMSTTNETVGFEPLAIALFYKTVREDLS